MKHVRYRTCTVSQLKWRLNSNPFKYNITQENHISFNYINYYSFNINCSSFYKIHSLFWNMKVLKVELKNFGFQHVNSHWLLDELSLASIRGGGWWWTNPQEMKKWKFADDKCIDAIHFIVSFMLQWIHCDPHRKKVCWIANGVMMQCLHFCWYAFHKRRTEFY